jgi:hypothetical protein
MANVNTVLKTEVEVEKIITGLTPNYLHTWSNAQALKEAVQNIAYGVVKSGKKAKIYFDEKTKMQVIRDYYTGFEKKHLYIGESEQRNDSQGLGTFGEGWKIFLLIMARNGIKHEIRTVGFTFWGTLEPTVHGTEVLIINVLENKNTVGTKVSVDLPVEDVELATRSFAVLNGIDMTYINVDSVIPDRKHELWVSGVRIEDSESTNPLNLYYSYNIRHRDLINRDRSHPNAELAYREIRSLIFNQSREFIEDFVVKAIEGSQYQDILRGPNFPWGEDEHKVVWLDVLASLHACEPNQLVIKSSNPSVNDEAKQQGYVLLDTPTQWNYELSYIGINKADTVLEDRYDVVETTYSTSSTQGKTPFSKAKLKVKKALGLSSVTDLPEFRYVEKIANPVSEWEQIFCRYDRSLDVIFIDVSIMEDENELTKQLLREGIRRKYDAKTSFDFQEAYEEITLRLL